MEPDVVLIAIAAVVGFVAIWSGVCFLLASLAGWRRLAQDFAALEVPERFDHRFVVGMVGPVAYNMALKLRLAEHGLFLSTLAPFRPGHTPLFIPWHALHPVVATRSWFGSQLELRVGRTDGVSLRLPLHVFERTPLANKS